MYRGGTSNDWERIRAPAERSVIRGSLDAQDVFAISRSPKDSSSVDPRWMPIGPFSVTLRPSIFVSCSSSSGLSARVLTPVISVARSKAKVKNTPRLMAMRQRRKGISVAVRAMRQRSLSPAFQR